MSVKRVVSVSLGSSKRNKIQHTTVEGQAFQIERIGTDGDLKAFARMFVELDGKVDVLGVGGADLWVVAGGKRYEFRQVRKLVSGAVHTPVVDGSALKHTLERGAIGWLGTEGGLDFQKERVLLVSAVDRYGMAQALSEACPNVLYGDFLFALGLPIPMRRYRAVEVLGKLLLPLITQLPIQWFYPTGEKQEKHTPKFAWAFDEATLIAGDWHFIRRFAPDSMAGKSVLSQTYRKADLDWLRSAGVAHAYATTPPMGGESFATNVMEGVLVALEGKRPEAFTEADWLGCIDRLGWKPSRFDLG